MTRFKMAIIGIIATVIVIPFASQHVQAQINPPPKHVQASSVPSQTLSLYLPIIVNRYQPPPPVYPPVNKIAYSSGYTSSNRVYNIFAVVPGQPIATQLTFQNSAQYLKPSWSPDGSKIAFYGGNQIWVMNADGSGQHGLINVAGHHVHPTWSPYGDRIAFSSDIYNPGPYPNHIYLVNTYGSNPPVSITDSNVLSDEWPDWSPDGKRIAFAGCNVTYYSCQIFTVAVDGSQRTNISNSAYYDYAPNWSPNGQKIVFYRNLGTSATPSRQIFVMNADGSGQTQLTFNSGQNWYPNWSPDGNLIAFQTYYSSYADIYTMHADGTGVLNVTGHQFTYASVHADWH